MSVRLSVCPVYVCMYVYVCICMYVCVYVCLYVCMYVCMYVCVYVCMYVYMYVCIMYVCPSFCLSCVCMYVCMPVCMNDMRQFCFFSRNRQRSLVPEMFHAFSEPINNTSHSIANSQEPTLCRSLIVGAQVCAFFFNAGDYRV